jgi:hypothetical protein
VVECAWAFTLRNSSCLQGDGLRSSERKRLISPTTGAGITTVFNQYVASCGASILAGTWGAYVVIGCLGQSELLLGSDLQECQGASQRQHDVRAQDSTCGDGSFEPLPVTGPFLVRCDECGHQHSYDPAEVLRIEMSTSETFTTHPRFL